MTTYESETVKGQSNTLRLRLSPTSEPITIDDSKSCELCSRPARYGPSKSQMSFTLGGVQRNGQLGCHWCAIAWSALTTYEAIIQTKLDLTQKLIIKTCAGRPPALGSLQWKLSEDDSWCRLHFSLHPRLESWGPFVRYDGVPTSARSKDSVQFCRDRLKHCQEHHTACCVEQGYMPTRLLSLKNGREAMRIVRSETLSDQIAAPYAALSHPWGKGTPVKLTSKSIEQLGRLILWEQLPQTYKDAIWVCQELNVDYLWIDSICIKQDDKADWDYEAARMADVYENACVVISASSCRSSSDSFLSPRTPSNCGPTTIAWAAEHNDDAQPLLQVHRQPFTGLHHLKGPEEPLQTRGWVYQEKMLARRLLDFTSQEIQWVCKSRRDCECLGEWEHNSRTLGEIHGTTNKSSIPVLDKHEWTRAAEEFSLRTLTFTTDKLPALSGLASRFKDIVHAQYVAGMWLDESFVEQLAWTRDENEKWKESQEETYRAPSFSWIASDSAITFRNQGHQQSYITVVCACSSLKHANPFGEVTDGFVILKGRLIQLNMRQPTSQGEPPQLEYADGTATNAPVMFDKPTWMNFFRVRDQILRDDVRKQRNLLWFAEHQGDCQDFLRCYALKLCSKWLDTTFLVLMDSVHEPGSYERIGLIYIYLFLEKRELVEAEMLPRWEAATEKMIRIV